MLKNLPYALFLVATMLTLVAFIRFGTLPRQRGRRRWQFSLQAMLLATTAVAILVGMVMMMVQ